jgi:hypothetical protein
MRHRETSTHSGSGRAQSGNAIDEGGKIRGVLAQGQDRYDCRPRIDCYLPSAIRIGHPIVTRIIGTDVNVCAAVLAVLDRTSL